MASCAFVVAKEVFHHGNSTIFTHMQNLNGQYRDKWGISRYSIDLFFLLFCALHGQNNPNMMDYKIVSIKIEITLNCFSLSQ